MFPNTKYTPAVFSVHFSNFLVAPRVSRELGHPKKPHPFLASDRVADSHARNNRPQTPRASRRGKCVREIIACGFSFDLDKTGTMRIKKVFPDTPATEAGLFPGLIIERINGVAAAGKSVSDCLAIMRGPAGTKVQLDFMAAHGSRTNTVELIKRRIQL